MQVLKKIGLGIAVMLASLNVFADYAWNFPLPVTPMAADTLHVHNKFMAITGIIFIVVLAIMIYAIFAHRKSKNFKAVTDKTPSTTVEIFWTLIPFVILFASVTGAVIGSLVAMRSKEGFAKPIPFGPFLAAGALLYLLGFGSSWTQWYLELHGLTT